MSRESTEQFGAEELVVLDEIALRSGRLSMQGLLRRWQSRCEAAGDYCSVIEECDDDVEYGRNARFDSALRDVIREYDNDLKVRDGLAHRPKDCPDSVQRKVAAVIERADQQFRDATFDDPGQALRRGRPSAADDLVNWWWTRRPALGGVPERLDGMARAPNSLLSVAADAQAMCAWRIPITVASITSRRTKRHWSPLPQAGWNLHGSSTRNPWRWIAMGTSI
jgi:hypothetical protein